MVRTGYKSFHAAELDLFAAGTLLKETKKEQRKWWKEQISSCEKAQEAAADSFAWMIRTLTESVPESNESRRIYVRRLVTDVVSESMFRGLASSRLTQEERARIYDEYAQMIGSLPRYAGEQVFLGTDEYRIRTRMYQEEEFVAFARLLCESRKAEERTGVFTVLIYHLLKAEEAMKGLYPWMSFRKSPASLAYQACRKAMDEIRRAIPRAMEENLDAREYLAKTGEITAKILGQAGKIAVFAGITGTLGMVTVLGAENPGMALLLAVIFGNAFRAAFFRKGEGRRLRGEVRKLRESRRQYRLSRELNPEE